MSIIDEERICSMKMDKIKTLGCVFLGLCAWTVFGAERVTLGEYGDLRLNGSRSFYWFHAGPNWSSNKRMNRTTLIPETIPSSPGKQIVAGRYVVSPKDSFHFRSELIRCGEEEYLYKVHFSSPTPVPSTALFWKMDVPLSGGAFRAEVDGRSCSAPAAYQALSLYESGKEKKCRKVVFQSGDRKVTLEGGFRVRIQDERRFRQDKISLRIFPDDSGSQIAECRMQMKIFLEPLKSTPIDLSKSVNMGFVDEIADDGKGGWTDQGPENDLVCMKSGKLELGGILFHVLDPAKNGGKSCLVLSEYRKYPRAGSVSADGKAHEYLYLLHGCAWGPAFRSPVGEIQVDYADGKRTSIPVLSGIDVGNWWRPAMSYPNGLLLWNGENAGGKVGLFVSAFKLENKGVRRIQFVPAETGVWMIAAASFANLHLELPIEKPYVVAEGNEWTKIQPVMKIRKNSPLDFSRFLHKPAGKYGFVVIDEKGKFTFENNRKMRVRFLGTNLCQSALFPSHEEAEALAEKLAASGYNSVRLHQFERGLMDRRANDTLTFDPDKLDRLQYLIAQLKKHGLYLCTDLYATRPIRPGDGIAECASANGSERKVLNYISPTAMENWKEYARRFLTVRNPYTGMSLLEDPALYSVNLDNEAPFPDIWAQYPAVVAAVERAYEAHLKERGVRRTDPHYDHKKLFPAYLSERQQKTQEEQIRFLRRLGAKFQITNLNNLAEKPIYQKYRAELDFIDSHIYHDHPSYPQARWTTPTAYHQRSAIDDAVRAFQNAMAIHMFGRPQTITELQFCNPNVHRAESGLITGALAALQDWDGIYRFSYTHDVRNLRQLNGLFGFDTVYDPIHALSERITWFLFRRGDASAAREKVEYEIPLDNPPVRFPENFRSMGLFAQIGSRTAAGKSPKLNASPEALSALKKFAETGKIRSSNGELELDTKNTVLRFQSPKSEGFVMRSGSCDGAFLSVRKSDTFASVSVHSLDNLPLTASRSILLFHLTNVANTGMTFRGPDCTLLDRSGHLPLLAHAGSAEIRLNLPSGTVTALALDGSVLGTIPAQQKDRKLVFPVRVRNFPQTAVFCYWITR